MNSTNSDVSDAAEERIPGIINVDTPTNPTDSVDESNSIKRSCLKRRSVKIALVAFILTVLAVLGTCLYFFVFNPATPRENTGYVAGHPMAVIPQASVIKEDGSLSYEHTLRYREANGNAYTYSYSADVVSGVISLDEFQQSNPVVGITVSSCSDINFKFDVHVPTELHGSSDATVEWVTSLFNETIYISGSGHYNCTASGDEAPTAFYRSITNVVMGATESYYDWYAWESITKQTVELSTEVVAHSTLFSNLQLKHEPIEDVSEIEFVPEQYGDKIYEVEKVSADTRPTSVAVAAAVPRKRRKFFTSSDDTDVLLTSISRSNMDSIYDTFQFTLSWTGDAKSGDSVYFTLYREEPLSWDPSSDDIEYELPSGTNSVVLNFKFSSFTDIDLEAGIFPYYIEVEWDCTLGFCDSSESSRFWLNEPRSTYSFNSQAEDYVMGTLNSTECADSETLACKLTQYGVEYDADIRCKECTAELQYRFRSLDMNYTSYSVNHVKASFDGSVSANLHLAALANVEYNSTKSWSPVTGFTALAFPYTIGLLTSSLTVKLDVDFGLEVNATASVNADFIASIPASDYLVQVQYTSVEDPNPPQTVTLTNPDPSPTTISTLEMTGHVDVTAMITPKVTVFPTSFINATASLPVFARIDLDAEYPAFDANFDSNYPVTNAFYTYPTDGCQKDHYIKYAISAGIKDTHVTAGFDIIGISMIIVNETFSSAFSKNIVAGCVWNPDPEQEAVTRTIYVASSSVDTVSLYNIRESVISMTGLSQQRLQVSSNTVSAFTPASALRVSGRLRSLAATDLTPMTLTVYQSEAGSADDSSEDAMAKVDTQSMANLNVVTFEWTADYSSWSECGNCSGSVGSQTRPIYCVEAGTANIVDDVYCEGSGSQPASTQSCSCATDYEWLAADDGWSECNDCSAGEGTKTRDVACVLTGTTDVVSDYNCNTYSKPDASAACYCPVESVKLTIKVNSEYQLDDEQLFAVFTKTKNVFVRSDSDFTSSRFLMIQQDYDLSNPYTPAIKVSAHITGMTVEQVQAKTYDISTELSSITEFSVSSVQVEESEVEYDCLSGCSSSGCGACLSGDECDVNGGDDCKNSAAGVHVTLVAVMAAVVAALLM